MSRNSSVAPAAVQPVVATVPPVTVPEFRTLTLNVRRAARGGDRAAHGGTYQAVWGNSGPSQSEFDFNVFFLWMRMLNSKFIVEIHVYKLVKH